MHSVHPNAPIMCKRADVIYRPGRSQIKASLRIFSKEKKDTSVSIGGVLFKVALNGVMVVRKMLFFGWPPINGAAINLSRGRFFTVSWVLCASFFCAGNLSFFAQRTIDTKCVMKKLVSSSSRKMLVPLGGSPHSLS